MSGKRQFTSRPWTVGIAMAIVAALASAGLGLLLSDRASACEIGGPTSGWRPPFLQAYKTSSHFGYRMHPISHTRKLHAGIDLVSKPAPGPVVAASGGTVVRAGRYGGLGNTVEIEHPGGVSTYYGHLKRIDVSVGRHVGIGDRIGFEGTTGNSTGEHLHFEVHRNGHPIDPVGFMQEHQAPLTGKAVGAPYNKGGGFALPGPGFPRKASLLNKTQPVPADIKALYVRAGTRYRLPWTLLAGIGMEETAHGKNKGVSSAGARGLMQFMPATWASMGVDGDGDGRADINNDADSAMSAARYLSQSGATKNPEGVRQAIYAYNHANWYVNDVLHYTRAYGGGTVGQRPASCAPPKVTTRPAIDAKRIDRVLTWGKQHVGDGHQLGAEGPHTWDASSYTRAAYGQIKVQMPRTAQQQRDWLAAGHGTRITPGQERPGDLIFFDSYRGPSTIGHVALVLDPKDKSTLEAKNPQAGVVKGSYADARLSSHIYEVWRVADPKPAKR